MGTVTISDNANLRGLATAVLAQAIKDLTSRNPAKQFYAALFFADEFSFSFWADCLNIYPDGWRLLSDNRKWRMKDAVPIGEE